MEKVASNISHIKKINIGNPNSLFVTKESIIRVVFASSLSPGLYVYAKAPDMNPYFSLAIADSMSSLSVASIFSTSALRIFINSG